jgi:nucleoid-associated protein YgaU/DNA-binding SARP family transcriptional activator
VNRVLVSAKAALAAAALGALLAGVPLALIALVGWPLPTRVPALEDVTTAFAHQSVDPHVLVKALALVAWVAWAQVAWAVVVEVRATVAGRIATAHHLLPGLQRHVARLVATVALGITSLTARPAAAAPEPAPLHTLVAVPAVDTTGRPHPLAAAPDAGPLPQWTVARHDTYWDIAERTLGDGHAWRRIRDLNIGRTMGDGTVISATSDLLRPGWTLLLPGDARPPHAEPAASTITVAPGQHLWSIAHDELAERLDRPPTTQETTEFWADIIDLNRSDIPNPDLLRPGDTVTLPNDTRIPTPAPPTEADAALRAPAPTIPAPAAPPSTTPTLGAAATTTLQHVIADGTDDSPAGEDTSAQAPGVLGVAGGLLAVGVAAAYRRRRTRAASSMPRGFDLPAPEGFEDLRAELALTGDVGCDERRAGALGDAVRSGAGVLAAVTDTDTATLTVTIAEPASPPLGWVASNDRRRWTLDGAAEPFDTGTWSPVPLLVAVGRDDAGEVAVNLEVLGVTSIVGDQIAVDDLVRAIAAQVTHAPPHRAAHLIALGTIADLAPGADRTADGWEDVADDLVALARQTAAQVAARGTPSAAAARLADADDALVPTLVLADAVPADDARFDELVALMDRGAAVAVLVAGPAAPATVITVDAGIVTVPVLDLTARPQQLPAKSAARIEELLDAAEAAADPAPLLDFGEDTTSDDGDVDADVTLRVLGRVRVDGTFRPLTPKQTAVIAFIALHAPVTGDRIEDGVWPAATGSRRKRLANVLSECRAALGANALPVAANGLYQFGPGVTSDAALFDAHVRAARHPSATPDAQRDALRNALELVEGPVFQTRTSHASSYAWVDLENLITTWELKIADAALTLIDLAGDDLDEAVWAAEQGLRAMPTHVELTESLMESLWQRGDTGAADRVYTSHVAALEAIALDGVAESTFTLWQQLRARETA